MKIYVLTSGEYSDYHIITATTDLEKAKKLAKKFTSKWTDVKIEEYEDRELNDLPMWYVGFDSNGTIIKFREEDDIAYVYARLNNYYETWLKTIDGYIYVAAETEEAAIKIAAEKRAEYLAKKEGIA